MTCYKSLNNKNNKKKITSLCDKTQFKYILGYISGGEAAFP